MENEKIHGKSRIKRLIEGRGFYAVLAVSLLAIAGIAFATFGGTLTKKPLDEPSEPSAPAHPVEQIVTGEPAEKKTTTTTASATEKPTTTTTAADLFVLPLSNTVLKSYSNDAPLYSETMKDWRTHDGTDFSGTQGQTVKALAVGTVKEVATDPLWGETVTIDHGMDVQSFYAGVHATVKVGDKVAVGQAIGTLIPIPCEAADAPHLHLEMIVDGERVDPVTALGREVRYAQTTATK